MALALAFGAAACSSTPTPAPSVAPTVAPTTPAPIDSPSAPPSDAETNLPSAPPAAIAACGAAQVQATPGDSGAAAGTSYLAVTFRLVQGTDCSLPRGPNLALSSEDGTVLVHDTDADPRPITLHDTLDYRIGWNVGCGTTVPRPTLARIELYGGAVLSVPIGAFGPSCVDGSTGRLFMVTDAP